jgi:hypothetical protein
MLVSVIGTQNSNSNLCISKASFGTPIDVTQNGNGPWKP